MDISILVGITAFYLFYHHIIKPKQHGKIKAKEETKERAVVDEVFREAPTCFLQDSYTDFSETPMMENKVTNYKN